MKILDFAFFMAIKNKDDNITKKELKKLFINPNGARF